MAFAGSIGAAKNIEALRREGVTHILNASPIVPCFHRQQFKYKVVSIYDDAHEDIARFFAETNKYISKVNASDDQSQLHHTEALLKSQASGNVCRNNEVRSSCPWRCLRCKIVMQGRRKGGVLVHCYAGMSRSATFILAYLLACKQSSALLISDDCAPRLFVSVKGR